MPKHDANLGFRIRGRRFAPWRLSAAAVALVGACGGTSGMENIILPPEWDGSMSAVGDASLFDGGVGTTPETGALPDATAAPDAFDATADGGIYDQDRVEPVRPDAKPPTPYDSGSHRSEGGTASEGGCGIRAPTTTFDILKAQGVGCFECARDNGCFDPTQQGLTCEDPIVDTFAVTGQDSQHLVYRQPDPPDPYKQNLTQAMRLERGSTYTFVDGVDGSATGAAPFTITLESDGASPFGSRDSGALVVQVSDNTALTLYDDQGAQTIAVPTCNTKSGLNCDCDYCRPPAPPDPASCDPRTYTDACTRTLQGIFDTRCAASLQLTACLCGATDIDMCLGGMATPSGPLFLTYVRDLEIATDMMSLKMSGPQIMPLFTMSKYGSTAANSIVQCAAAFMCPCFADAGP